MFRRQFFFIFRYFYSFSAPKRGVQSIPRGAARLLVFFSFQTKQFSPNFDHFFARNPVFHINPLAGLHRPVVGPRAHELVGPRARATKSACGAAPTCRGPTGPRARGPTSSGNQIGRCLTTDLPRRVIEDPYSQAV